MKRFVLIAVVAVAVVACGGMEIDDAEAAPSTGAAASCTPITAATRASARFCTINIAAGSCSVVSGSCSGCVLSGSTATVTFSAPIALTMTLQHFVKAQNDVYDASFSKSSCSASQAVTFSATPADLVGTQWTLTDQDPNNPT